MRPYCVSYDLKKPGQNYAGLIDELKKCAEWWHYLGSTWLVTTNESVHQLSARLRQVIDKNDDLLVIGITNDHDGWLPPDAWPWIKRNT